MEATEITLNKISALNDLIKLNTDRVTGYKKGVEGTKDADLKTLFSDYISQSQGFIDILKVEVLKLGGTISEEPTLAGKFYHAWMGIKSALTGKNRASILHDCEYGDDIARKSYQDALEDLDLIWDSRMVGLLEDQHFAIEDAHEHIKSLLDKSSK